MRAVIYARYSSDNQREESIEGQLRECMEFANRSGATVIETYIDRALTAKTDNRPDFQRMIKDSYKHAFDVVIVWKLDRFARNRYDSAHYKAILKKNGVKVVSAKEVIAEGSEGILLESVLEGMAEYYSAELSEKVIRGMTENALKGKSNGGNITLGYKVDENLKFVVDENFAPIIQEVFTMYADGKAIKEIVAHLKDLGIRTKNNNNFITYNMVQYMLSNRKYIGEYKYRGHLVENAIPPIISEELFNKVQDVLKSNKHAPARHKAEDDYLLTTKLFCGKCGAFMVGESGRNRHNTLYHYYKCVNAKKHTCDKKTVKKDWIENIAVKYALEILNNDRLVDILTEKLFILQNQENPRLPRLKEQLKDLEKRIFNIVDTIERGFVANSTLERLQELEKTKKDLELSILQEELEKPLLTKDQIKFGIEKFKKLDVSTKEGKQRLIDGFINSIVLYDDKITFIFNYKDGTKTVTLDEISNSECSDFKSIGSPEIASLELAIFL